MNDINTYLIVFAGVLFLALGSTPLARKWGLSAGLVDQPDPARKIHVRPTPRVGGVAIFLSTLIAALLLRGAYRELTGILVGAALMSSLGYCWLLAFRSACSRGRRSTSLSQSCGSSASRTR